MPPGAVRHIKAPALWRIFGLGACALTLGSGSVYLVLQAGAEAPLTDLWLVIVVTLNAAAVYGVGWYLARNLAELLHHLPVTERVKALTLQERVDRILAHPPAVGLGIAWGLLVATLAQAIVPWARGTELHRWFMIFVFSGNLMIGFAIWAVLRYWIGFLQALPAVELNVLNPSREPMPAFLRFNSRVVLLAAFVGSMAIFSLAASGYDGSLPIVAFSVFSLALVGATYAVPIVPLSNLLGREKARALDAIEAQIATRIAAVTDPDVDTTGLKSLEDLRAAQALVAEIRILPPGGQISVSATAVVTALSFLPAIIEYASRIIGVSAP
jgi:hypothetical protein